MNLIKYILRSLSTNNSYLVIFSLIQLGNIPTIKLVHKIRLVKVLFGNLRITIVSLNNSMNLLVQQSVNAKKPFARN